MDFFAVFLEVLKFVLLMSLFPLLETIHNKLCEYTALLGDRLSGILDLATFILGLTLYITLWVMFLINFLTNFLGV